MVVMNEGRYLSSLARNVYIGSNQRIAISMKLFTLKTTGLLAIGLALAFSACDKNKIESINGRTYGVQCYWTGGPNDFSPKVTFNEGGTVSHRDDTTSSLSGTFSVSESTVTWTLDNPPNNTRFRGTFDSKRLDGNVEDDLGNTAIFQGLRE